MTSGEVMRRCLSQWRIYTDQVIPRCYLPGWEADLLVLRRSGWAEEVEIKVSAGDFRCEWKTKAEKHESLKLGRLKLLGHEWGTPAAGWPAESFKRGERVYVREPHIIRRFWFAMPEELAEKLLPEVPEAYGVLAVGQWTRVLRRSTALRSARKITDAERLHALNSTYARFWAMTLREQRTELTLELTG